VFLDFNKHKQLILPTDKKFTKILKEILGFRPRNLKYYQKAVIHKSATKILKDGQSYNNERLEFLGDSVLDAIIAEYLFKTFEGKDEGFLTQMRSKIVNREFLNHLAMKLGINHLVISNTANNPHKYIYGDALEALIGAVYIDKGFAVTQKFIIKRLVKNHVNLKKLISQETDFKSRIIEWGQKNKTLITFESAEQLTDDNTSQVAFVAQVFVGENLKGQGIGYSKKEAEQNAAKQALEQVVLSNTNH